jgi:inosose dehydratase
VALAPNRAVFDDEQWASLASGLDELGKIARDEGMRLCYHHHMGTGVQTREDVDRLMDMTDPDLVHLLLDTGHIHFAGDDPLSLADAYAERISHVHLKNIRQPVMDEALANGYSFEEAIKHGVFTVPGDPEGCIDFGPILELLAGRGYRGWLVVEAEQDPTKANPLDHAVMARAYLREVLGF